MPSSHLILCRPLLFLPPVPPSILYRRLLNYPWLDGIAFAYVRKSLPHFLLSLCPQTQTVPFMATTLRSSSVFHFFLFTKVYLSVGCTVSLLPHWLYSDFKYSCGAWASYCDGFSCCRAWAQQLSHMGLVALWHMGSSQTRDRNCISHAGRQILYH